MSAFGSIPSDVAAFIGGIFFVYVLGFGIGLTISAMRRFFDTI